MRLIKTALYEVIYIYDTNFNCNKPIVCVLLCKNYEMQVKKKKKPNGYMGQCKRKLGFYNFFQVFKFNSFWIHAQDSALYKTVLIRIQNWTLYQRATKR